MKIDRGIQKELLEKAADVYPNQLPMTDQSAAYVTNAIYLEEHRLIRCASIKTYDGVGVAAITITAAGLDFLADDGGLTAVLGVVDVRLHADTIKALVSARIGAADLPENERSALRSQIESLPGTALTHLTNKLVELGLESGPQALAAIRTVLAGVGG